MYYDVIVIGAGAAGLMAAYEAGKRGKVTLLIEHSDKIGEKIRISGGGRCNFTNLHAKSDNYLSNNPHFIKSALAGYNQFDFIKLIESHGITYHEKTLGQLFCDGSAKQIIQMFIGLCERSGVKIRKNCHVQTIAKADYFDVKTHEKTYSSKALIIATGGLSIPKMGATDFGYRIAKKFGHKIIETRPALVPLTVSGDSLNFFKELSGVSNYSRVSYKKTSFLENLLFTHRGLSGPAILQISSYLKKFKGEKIKIDLLPNRNLKEEFLRHKKNTQTPASLLKECLTNRFVDSLSNNANFHKKITDLKKEDLITIAEKIHNFEILVDSSEGFQKAEVTAGGVDTKDLSSKTMQSQRVPGLFFIGEVVDVTGWLGGYNFQWAWSSGFAAGNNC